MKPTQLIASLAAMACMIATVCAETYTGKIVRFDATKKTFTLKSGGKDLTFQVDKATKFLDAESKPAPMLGDFDGIWSDFPGSITTVAGPNMVAETVQFPVKIMTATEPVPPGTRFDHRKAGGKMPDPTAMVGKPMPGFDMKTVDGKKLTSSMTRGKVTVIDFWATWCKPCTMVSPILQELHKTLQSKGVTVIGAGSREQDAKAKIKEYATKHGYTYAMTYDNDALADKLGVMGIPCLVIVDKKGIIRKVHVGYTEDLKATLEAEVRELLKH